jgi:integrase
LALAVVRDLREYRAPVSEEELAEFETDVLAGFVLARASAGLVDSTIRSDTNHLELIRDWFGRPLWEMAPSDADVYFGKALRDAKPSPRTGRAGALAVFFRFLELRHKVELHNLTGRVVECPLDEMNRPRASVEPQLRIPPGEADIEALFAGWREELVTCRKFGPAARNYAVARLAADVGLRINEARMLDRDDVQWELGRFGKLNVRHGKGSRRRGPKPRLMPLINGPTATCGGSSRTCGATLTPTTPGRAPRCSPPRARTGTVPARGRLRMSTAGRWPRPPPSTCRPGPGSSPRTCCGTSAPPSSISPA